MTSALWHRNIPAGWLRGKCKAAGLNKLKLHRNKKAVLQSMETAFEKFIR
jgi:hypothetical protein